jgi:transcriptional regulator with XRE-family HTH domain
MASERRRTVGQALREKREEKHLDVEEVALRAFIPTADLISYENGDRLPQPRTVEQLAHALRCPPRRTPHPSKTNGPALAQPVSSAWHPSIVRFRPS